MNPEKDEIDVQVREERATNQKRTTRFGLILLVVYGVLSTSHWLFSIPSNGTVLDLTGGLLVVCLILILDQYVNTFILEFRLRSKRIDQKLIALDSRIKALSMRLHPTAGGEISELDQDSDEDQIKKDESDEAVVARYRAAAERGEVWAQHNLGVTYSNGDRLPKDKVQAAFWYKKAAEQGDTPSRFYLAELLSGGQGIEPDYAEAIRLYRLVADDAHTYSGMAESSLGEIYARGRGVPRDYSEAVRFWERAAKHGWSLAAGSLGNLYEKGAEGVAQDYSQAYFWYVISIRIDGGKSIAQYRISERDSAAHHLDSESLQCALDHVERWFAADTAALRL